MSIASLPRFIWPEPAGNTIDIIFEGVKKDTLQDFVNNFNSAIHDGSPAQGVWANIFNGICQGYVK